MVADPSLPHDAGGADTQARAATLPEAARSAAMRQLIARSVLHGAALRSLLAAGR
jgi:hypothetical protein